MKREEFTVLSIWLGTLVVAGALAFATGYGLGADHANKQVSTMRNCVARCEQTGSKEEPYLFARCTAFCWGQIEDQQP